MIRTRKAGSVTMINYLSASFIYTKVANIILWFYADYLMGIIYTVIFVCKYQLNYRNEVIAICIDIVQNTI